MEPLPSPWFSRKRRRSNTETEGTLFYIYCFKFVVTRHSYYNMILGEGKMVKTDAQEKMDTADVASTE